MAKLGQSCAVLNQMVLGRPCGSAPPPPVPEPGFYVAADWDSDGIPNDGLSQQVLETSITRGIDPTVGRLMSASAQFTLKNHDGRFSPLRTDSPLYPKVKIGKGIAAWREDSTLALSRQFTGQIREISLDPAPTTRKAVFDCADFIEVLRRKLISTPLYRDKRSDQLIAAILALAGWTGATNLEQGSRTFPFASWRNTSALDAIQQVIDSELGTFFIAADGTPTFHARYHRFGASAEATFNNSMSSLSWTLNADNIANEVVVTAYPRNIGVPGTNPVVLWTLCSWQEVPYLLPPGASFSLDLDFVNPSGGGACEAVDVVQPVATTDYRASSARTGGTNKTSSLSVAAFTAYGQYATITITNTDTVEIYVTFLQVRGKPVVTLDPVVKREIDQESIDEYGFTATLSLDQRLESSADAAQQAATILIQTNAYARPQLEITVTPGDDDRLDAIAHLDLNAAVSVSEPGTGMDEAVLFIDQITHTVSGHAASQTTVYQLSQTPQLVFIILDSLTQTSDDLLGV